MSDDGLSDDAIKRRRAIRSGLAALLAVPPLVMLLVSGGPMVAWPVGWKLAFSLCLGLSFLAGWKPGKKTWWGDQSIYVDEPEVDDDW